MFAASSQQQTALRSSAMVRRSSMHFQRLNASVYNQTQVVSRSRTSCVTACFDSNFCQTFTFIVQQSACFLFGEPLDEGLLIANVSAETVYLAKRNPLLCDPSCLNGGKCIVRNTCFCPSNFMGPSCEYPIACSVNDSFVGTALFLNTFGSGSNQSSSTPPSAYNFSTNYTQAFGSEVSDGSFGFVNAVSSFSGWHAGAIDHTPNDTNGYMFLINSGWSATEMYRRTVTNLCVGLRYEFSFYAANPIGSWAWSNVAANLQISVRSGGANQTLFYTSTTGSLAVYSTMTWLRFSFSFVVPTSSIVISFTSIATGSLGNDVAVDDLLFGVCTNATNGMCP